MMMVAMAIVDHDKEEGRAGGLGQRKENLFTSLPTGIPLPRPAVRPMTLAMKAFRVRYSFSTTPLRMVFSSGIPEPERGGGFGGREKKHLWTRSVCTCVFGFSHFHVFSAFCFLLFSQYVSNILSKSLFKLVADHK